nr:unnamed protein product [Digitaria exilis]
MAAPYASSSARARAPPLPAAAGARPLHPLAGVEEGEAVAATHPGAHRVRRRGRKQKQVREKLHFLHRDGALFIFVVPFGLRGADGVSVLAGHAGGAMQLWPKTVLRKWLNIRSPESDFSADEGDTTDDTDSEVEYEAEMCAWERKLHDEERSFHGFGAETIGDLNYRINLPYEKTHQLISKQDWNELFEKDQLKVELKKGHLFEGWTEGVVNFPPTYKYKVNSEKYIGDDHKSGRRTPAWCDRILSYGNGMRLLSYKTVDLRLSDHRPVTAVYMVDVEVFSSKKLQRALTFTDAEAEEQLSFEEDSTSGIYNLGLC